MDLSQRKLSKQEWSNAEIPVSDDEKVILGLIHDGYSNVNIRINMNQSLLQILKIDFTLDIEFYLYKKYFEKEVQDILKKYDKQGKISLAEIMKQGSSTKPPKKADLIRIQNMDSNYQLNQQKIFEVVLLNFCKNMFKSIHAKTMEYAFYLYTILQLKKSSIANLNSYLIRFVECSCDYVNSLVSIQDIIQKSYDFIEKNPYLLRFEDMCLFNHQKQLFTIFKQSTRPKLVLYIAPTGTGKTLSPIGLSKNYRIIFICVARHVGLALAKSAISMNKKIAFAFGCQTASDIRLHYFAASNYTINRKSGGIGKVDNSEGGRVEIMICDVKSYITAMHYMLAFNDEENIITYWDEPTITMDYETHELHETIQKNWQENKISKLVLSCATLPKEDEIAETITDFRARFDNADIHMITSYDCKKTISLLNSQNMCVLPHYMFAEWSEIQECVRYCDDNKTLLRYFDLKELIRFIDFVNSKEDYLPSTYRFDAFFQHISDITMNSLKVYYLEVLKHLDSSHWQEIHHYMSRTREMKFADKPNVLHKVTSLDASVLNQVHLNGSRLMKHNSMDHHMIERTIASSASDGILFTTKDAHTLTDGPTIFLADDIHKIGMFYIHKSNIPMLLLEKIKEKIQHNNAVQKRMDELQKTLEDKTGQSKNVNDDDDDKKTSKKLDRQDQNPEIRKLMTQLDALREEVCMISLDPCYVPNTKQHQQVWLKDRTVANAFVPSIDESVVKDIVMLDITEQQKMLLLLGIGMFEATKLDATPSHIKYMEIMKMLAYEQKLFIIIASSDYIYGTNYQFCHGMIAKDLTEGMTQQKIIQAMGRIGRNKIQQEYTVRFRDDDILKKLFTRMTDNMEAKNMCRLFS
jgi:hypothetical protein